jgi:hypothetical protein
MEKDKKKVVGPRKWDPEKKHKGEHKREGIKAKGKHRQKR